jgi:hypothetical protein
LPAQGLSSSKLAREDQSMDSEYPFFRFFSDLILNKMSGCSACADAPVSMADLQKKYPLSAETTFFLETQRRLKSLEKIVETQTDQIQKLTSQVDRLTQKVDSLTRDVESEFQYNAQLHGVYRTSG